MERRQCDVSELFHCCVDKNENEDRPDCGDKTEIKSESLPPNPPAAETSDTLSSSSWWWCDHCGWAMTSWFPIPWPPSPPRPPRPHPRPPPHPTPSPSPLYHGDDVITVGGHHGFTAVIQYHLLNSFFNCFQRIRQRRNILYWFQQTDSAQEKL